jgi:hypothetical protein
MTPVQQFIAAIAVALAGSVLSPPIVLKILERKEAREQRDAEKRDEQKRGDEKRREHEEEIAQLERDLWLKQSREAFTDMEKRYQDCNSKLDRFANAFYLVLEELEDQVVTMLMLPDVDNAQVREVVRAIVRRARVATRDPLDPPTINGRPPSN